MFGIHPALVAVMLFALVYPFIPNINLGFTEFAVADSYWTGNVTAGLLLAFPALGLLVVVGWGREISLAQAGLTGASLYITGYAIRGGKEGEAGWDLPFPLAASVGIAFAVLVSVLVALVAMRLSGVYVIVLTLSLQFLIENSLFTEEKLTGGQSAPSTPRPDIFGMSLTCSSPCDSKFSSDDRLYFFILAFLFVSMVFLYRFRHSRFGRSLIMVGVDKNAAAAVGVSPWRYKVAAFAIAGLFAGLGGALLSPYYGNPPSPFDFTAFNSLFYLSIPILAGFESLMAVVGVALLFQLLPQILIDLEINPFLLGGLGLTIGVLVGPRGIGGFISDLFDSRAREKRRIAKANQARALREAEGKVLT
ncbi:MAG: branched-chain amino acid ABC transporter permease [Sporichthyaceae bacterium]